MGFYQAMQLSAANLKPLIKNAESKEIKNKYIAALILKSILCLLFCTIVVISFGKVFGEENNVVGVVTVISLLNFNIYKKNSQYYTGKFKNFDLFVIIG